MSSRKYVSTHEIETTGFAPHGTMGLVVIERLNVIEAQGPFNIELVKAGDWAQEKVDAELQAQGRWGTLLIFRQSALTSLDALDEIENILKRRKARGICPAGVAIVLGPEVEGAQLMSPFYLRAYTNAGVLAQVFEDRETAQAWLLAQINS